MVKNSSAFGDIEISPLSGAFDLRSPSGTMPISDFRLVLNASMNEAGKRCRRPQFKKFGADSPRGFNNQDLHDRLDGSGYYCYGGDDDCNCVGAPNCLELAGYDPDNFLEVCDGLIESSMPVWDGRFGNLSACRWGFGFYAASTGGIDLAGVLSLKTCPPTGPVTYQLSFMGRNSSGEGITIWSGDSPVTPVGTYVRTGGCDETPEFRLVNCDTCDQPVVTASPPSGSAVAAGTYISLFATFGATIFFTTDGTEPDNTSEEYTGPFQISDDTTIKAIAYTLSCISEVETFIYTINDDFIFEFTCDDEDQAGVFDEFEPNGSDDYNWRLRFTLPEVDITRVEIYESDASGNWVTGQAWATDNPINPVELGGSDFAVYPLVIFDTGTRIADQYETTLITANPAGSYEWLMYGQPFIPLVGYFHIIMFYNEAGEDKELHSVIPHECYYYY